MERLADALATLLTFLLFLALILSPMLMAFLKSKTVQRKDTKKSSEKKKQKREVSFLDIFRQEDRISEPAVTFSKEQGAGKQSHPPGEKEEKSTEVQTSFEDVQEAFDRPLSKVFSSIDDTGPTDTVDSFYDDTEQGEQTGGRIPPGINRLPALKRAVILAEILGRPKGLGDESRYE